MISQLFLLITLLSTTFCDTSNRILGGAKIDIEAAPYQVAIFYDSHQYCGGSLMSRNFVLSAAHCFYGDHFPGLTLNVRIGTSTPKDGSGLSIKVKSIYNHPEFNKITTDYDFSLLRLNDVDKFPSIVQFVKLPTLFDQLNDGDEVFISGWGRTEFGVGSNALLGATVEISNFETCRKNYEGINLTVTERMICAGKDGGKVDSCSGMNFKLIRKESKWNIFWFFLGDSGGPLVRKSDGILFGVTSFGCGCGNAKYPGVYAKVSYVLEWISEVMSSDSDSGITQNEPHECDFKFGLKYRR